MNQDIPQFEDEMVEIDLREYINLLWQKKWIIILIFVLAVTVSYFFSQQMTRIYETEILVMVEEEEDASELFSEEISFGRQPGDKIATYNEMIKSRRILEEVIEDLDLKNEETGEYISADSLRNNISINRSGETDLMRLTVTYPDPEIARDIANTTIEVFQDENMDINMADLQGASDFIEEQLAEVQTRLNEFEEELLEYQKQNEVYYPDEQGKQYLDRLSTLEEGLAETTVEINQAEASLKEVDKNLSEEDREIISSRSLTRNPVISDLKSKLTELQTDLTAKRSTYTDKHPEVEQLKARKESIEEELDEEVEEIVGSKTETINPIYESLKEKKIELETQTITAEASKESYQARIDEVEDELNKLPDEQLKLARLQREKDLTEEIYLMLMNRQEEINIQKSMQTSDIVVVDEAIVNEEPIKPNIKLNMAIAGVLGLMVGVFIVFLMEFLDTTVKEEKDIEKLTGLPVLGIIPDVAEVDHDRGYGRGEDNE